MQEKILDLWRIAVAADPLFAAHGLDIPSARSALDELEQSIRRLERSFCAGSFLFRIFFLRFRLTRYVYPLGFLRGVVESEHARRHFETHPSLENAQALARQWRKTARELLRHLRRYRFMHRALLSLEKDADTYTYTDMFGNITTLDDVFSQLDRLDENAQTVLKEAIQREKFLNGEVSAFHSEGSAAPTPAIPESSTLSFENRFGFLHEMQLKFKVFSEEGDVHQSWGPYYYALPHFDGVPTVHEFYFCLLKKEGKSHDTSRIFLSDEFFFLKIGEGARGYGGIGRAGFRLIEPLNIPYWSQSPTNLYTCRDQQYQATIASFADLERRPFLDASAVMSQKCSLLDYLIREVSRDLFRYANHMFGRAKTGDAASYSLLYGLLARSHPSIMYLPFNKSVWRLDTPLNSLGSGRVPDSEQLYRRAAEIVPQLSRETLELIMRAGHIREELRRARGHI